MQIRYREGDAIICLTCENLAIEASDEAISAHVGHMLVLGWIVPQPEPPAPEAIQAESAEAAEPESAEPEPTLVQPAEGDFS